jgi:hypothetical protein
VGELGLACSPSFISSVIGRIAAMVERGDFTLAGDAGVADDLAAARTREPA